MEQYTTYIIGNIVVKESLKPGIIEIGMGEDPLDSLDNTFEVTKENFGALCDLRFRVIFQEEPK